MNKYAVDIAKKFEGFRVTPYYDASGFLTIGFGTRIKSKDEYPNGVTEEEAENLLVEHMERSEAVLDREITVPTSDKQFGALLSLCYNIGEGNFLKSTLLRKLNQSDYAGAADQFSVWCRSGGRELPGLIRRRAAEKALFEENIA